MNPAIAALMVASTAAYGAHLLWTSLTMGWSGLGPGPRANRSRLGGRSLHDWLQQAGLDEVQPTQFLFVTAAIGLSALIVTFGLFGAAMPALVVGVFAATAPAASLRRRRQVRRERAQEAWPRIIEEIRILTTSVGRSVPQALFDAGHRAPDELQSAFDAAHREWLITTDFARTIAILKTRLADPTADSACETLLVAHEVGGADLDRRLEALAEDRIQDLQGRRDARAQQAGVRFARNFVLIVPFGMALAGMSVGNGKAAYQEPGAQVIVAAAVLLVVACWVWSGRIMRLPEEERVLNS